MSFVWGEVRATSTGPAQLYFADDDIDPRNNKRYSLDAPNFPFEPFRFPGPRFSEREAVHQVDRIEVVNAVAFNSDVLLWTEFQFATTRDGVPFMSDNLRVRVGAYRFQVIGTIRGAPRRSFILRKTVWDEFFMAPFKDYPDTENTLMISPTVQCGYNFAVRLNTPVVLFWSGNTLRAVGEIKSPKVLARLTGWRAR